MTARRRILVVLGGILASLIVAVTLWTGITMHFTYSAGERSGYMQKISRKGWLCKTWEGEVVVAVVPGAAQERFAFTVSEDSIAHRMEALQGKEVVVQYAQHRGIPSSCFGDTEYFVTAVRPVR